MIAIIDPDDLRKARAVSLTEVEKTTRSMSRRVATPAERQALAEIEEVLRRARLEWEERGLVAA